MLRRHCDRDQVDAWLAGGRYPDASAEVLRHIREWRGIREPLSDAKPRTATGPAASELLVARERYCADRPLSATKKGAPCPVVGCEGKNSYKGDARHASCFHATHPAACGGPCKGSVARRFDSLDVDAHNLGRRPAQHLRLEGYLR